jgi:CDP-diacylglycerol--glycerol-3-phosphate 3-phosphatidyltransferase
VINIKHLASIVTVGRMVGAFALFLTIPLSFQFFVIYFLCCISDVLDGNIARKTKTTSKLGEILDSVADFILIAVMIIILFPLLTLELWAIYWIGIIALIRFLSLSVGFAKYHSLAFLHTYTNKITGVALVCFPIFLQLFGITVTAIILCGIATFSACEELIINIRSHVLNRNVKSVFNGEDGQN